MTRIGAPVTGTNLQMSLLHVAKDLGYLVQMTRRSQMCRTESSSGYPDLFCAKPGLLVWIECKSKYEKLSAEQEEWKATIAGPGPWTSKFTVRDGVDGQSVLRYIVARPADYDAIVKLLERGAKP